MINTMKSKGFWNYVDKSDHCWHWIGGKWPFGYGIVWDKEKRRPAHRVSWEIHFGDVPIGMCVLHKCDTPSCVRPDHLWLGTKAENNHDMAEKGRQCRGERSPRAKISPESIKEIKRLRKFGHPYRFIAKTYGVSISAISHIVSGRSWRHLNHQDQEPHTPKT